MRITVLTADFAQTDDRGKVNMIGGSWSTVSSPLSAHGVAVIMEFDWHEANEKHQFVLELLDEDGHPVVLGDGDEAAPVIRIEGEIEVGRPPGLPKGTPLMQTFAANFPGGMPLTPGHRYEYRARVGSASGEATFSVIQTL